MHGNRKSEGETLKEVVRGKIDECQEEGLKMQESMISERIQGYEALVKVTSADVHGAVAVTVADGSGI